MGADGRISQPIGDIISNGFFGEAPKNDVNRVDFLKIEKRRELGDLLFDLRFGSIDDLPKHKITQNDPNHSKYKCKLNWMTKLYLYLAKADEDGLFGEKERKIFEDYKKFLFERKERDKIRMEKLLTPEVRVKLLRINQEQGVQAYLNEIKEKYWVPTEPQDIEFINNTLDNLVYLLSKQSDNVLH